MQEAGVRHVLAWPAGRPAPLLAATHFAHAFFGALGNPATTVPEVRGGSAECAAGLGTWLGMQPCSLTMHLLTSASFPAP